MPPSGNITLTPKGKQGKEVTFTDILADGLVPDALFAGGDTFLSYSYGTKGKPKDKTIFGTGSNEYLVTGDGNDTIYMYGGNDIVVSGGGNDIINTGDGDDMVISGAGDDTIRAGTGSNYIDGGAGIDTYVMEPGYGDDVDLSAGTMKIGDATIDVLFYIENVTGNDGDNVIIGDGNVNYLATGGGVDTVYGGGGNDQIDASTQFGVKTLYGEAGDDTIFGGQDGDQISGGEGSDTISGGKGSDTISGGKGNDAIDLDEEIKVTDQIMWASGDGTDTIEFFDTSADAVDGGDMLVLDLAGSQGSDLQALYDSGYVDFAASGTTGTLVLVDPDGPGTGGYETAFVIDGTAYVDDDASIALFQGNITDAADVPLV